MPPTPRRFSVAYAARGKQPTPRASTKLPWLNCALTREAERIATAGGPDHERRLPLPNKNASPFQSSLDRGRQCRALEFASLCGGRNTQMRASIPALETNLRTAPAGPLLD